MSRRKSSPKTMTDDQRLAKNQRIKDTMNATRKRRSGMDCKVYSIKVSRSRLNGTQKESLTRLFLEAKWVRNALIGSGDFTRESLKKFRDEVNEAIYFQDENISGWKNKKSKARGSKKIHHGILGRVKSRLKNLDNAVCLDRYLPTTQLCVCGKKNPHGLDKRIYSCPSCGYAEDRDVHAALNMIRIGRFLDENNSTDLGQIRTPVEFPVRPAKMLSYNMEAGTETVKRGAAMSLASP